MLVKTEFKISGIRVQMYTDNAGIEVHVMGSEQDPREDGKFYIKLWMTKYKKNVQQVLDIIK